MTITAPASTPFTLAVEQTNTITRWGCTTCHFAGFTTAERVTWFDSDGDEHDLCAYCLVAIAKADDPAAEIAALLRRRADHERHWADHLDQQAAGLWTVDVGVLHGWLDRHWVGGSTAALDADPLSTR